MTIGDHPSRRRIVLVFVRYYLPGYKAGGPLRSIANMVEALGDEFDFRIVTLDRDAGDGEPYPDQDVPGWKRVGKACVLYLSPGETRLRRIAAILRETPHDILYLNSFFDPHFTLKPLLARRLGLAPARRCVLAPRGEFSPEALHLKPAKKAAYIRLASLMGLCRDLHWHASSAHEEADIRRVMCGSVRSLQVAIDMPAAASPGPSPHPHREPGQPLRICFLSRISPMKNLDYALDVLAKIDVPVTFDIYGAIEDEACWDRCRKMIAFLPGNVVAAHHGVVPHAEVTGTLARYDLFFLPTRGESYGHAIVEALAAGTPVLISDRTPWQGLAGHGVGWDLPLANPDAFVNAITEIASWPSDRRSEQRQRCLAFAEDHMRSDAVLAATRSLFAEPSPADAVAYHSALAAGWDARYAAGSFARRARFFEREILPRLSEGGTWLDAGCGTGTFARMLAWHGHRVVAVDASAAMLDDAMAKASDHADAIAFRHVDTVERLPFEDGRFDGVVCLSVLEYVDRPLGALRELCRVLRPGGMLVFSVPDRRSALRATQKVLHRIQQPQDRSLAYLSLSRFDATPTEMAAALEACGLTAAVTIAFDPVIPRIFHRLARPSLLYFICTKRAL
jgi:SAM-dependent methyltransferase/glycosyltransferase involved in cell wall biosynthesis